MCTWTLTRWRWIRSGWRGGDMRIATSASRIDRSSSESSTTRLTWISGERSRNSRIRGVSQIEPKSTVVVIFSGPFGRSFDSEIRLSDIASLAKTSRAVRNNSSPCSVRMRPRACRWNSGTLRLSSSALICRLTADWLRFSASPAWVKLPASATAWNTLNLSQSIPSPQRHHPEDPTGCNRRSRRSLRGLERALVLVRGEEFLRLERRHAAHPGGGDGLAKDLVLDVAGGIDAGDLGGGRIRPRDDIAFAVESQLTLEYLRHWRMPDGDEDTVAGDLPRRRGFGVAYDDAGNARRVLLADDLLDDAVPYDGDLGMAEQPILQDLLGAQLITAMNE